MFGYEEKLGKDDCVDHKTINFETFLSPDQILVKLFGGICTEQADDNDSGGDHIVGRWNLIYVFEEENTQVIYLELL